MNTLCPRPASIAVKTAPTSGIPYHPVGANLFAIRVKTGSHFSKMQIQE
jgi:hypothetical protein